MRMKELDWMAGWNLDVYELDQHNRQVFLIINKLIYTASNNEIEGHSFKLKQVVDSEFLPYLDDFNFIVLDIINTLEAQGGRKLGRQYRLFKQDYLDSISDLISYLRGAPTDKVDDLICIAEIREWFILYMMRVKLLMTFWRDLHRVSTQKIYRVTA